MGRRAQNETYQNRDQSELMGEFSQVSEYKMYKIQLYFYTPAMNNLKMKLGKQLHLQ